MSVTFETKCWENDYRIIMGGRLVEMVTNCDFKFDEVALIINNVNDITEAERLAKGMLERGEITRYEVAERMKDKALSHFGLTEESLGIGYVYSIAELVGIVTCTTDYLVHFSSDTISYGKWVDIGINHLTENVFVANPRWNMAEASAEAYRETDECWIGYGFSDQCYLIRVEDMLMADLNTTHEFSSRYPKYGGELFEKRVDSYMLNNDKVRATVKNARYVHKNF